MVAKLERLNGLLYIYFFMAKYFHIGLAFLLFNVFFSSCKSHRHITRKDPQPNTKTNTPEQFKQLRAEIDAWLWVPYKYGGQDKKGVDCSALACSIYKSVYGKIIPRTAKDQYAMCQKISMNELVEGDLVFFKIESTEISHVGVYLQNRQFIHASEAKGVVISDLNNSYYIRYFVGGGRY